MAQAARDFCRGKSIITAPQVDIFSTFKPGRREYQALNDDTADDNYEISIKSIPNCAQRGSFNLAEPVRGYTCEKILENTWKNWKSLSCKVVYQSPLCRTSVLHLALTIISYPSSASIIAYIVCLLI